MAKPDTEIPNTSQPQKKEKEYMPSEKTPDSQGNPDVQNPAGSRQGNL